MASCLKCGKFTRSKDRICDECYNLKNHAGRYTGFNFLVPIVVAALMIVVGFLYQPILEWVKIHVISFIIFFPVIILVVVSYIVPKGKNRTILSYIVLVIYSIISILFISALLYAYIKNIDNLYTVLFMSFILSILFIILAYHKIKNDTALFDSMKNIAAYVFIILISSTILVMSISMSKDVNANEFTNSTNVSLPINATSWGVINKQCRIVNLTNYSGETFETEQECFDYVW